MPGFQAFHDYLMELEKYAFCEVKKINEMHFFLKRKHFFFKCLEEIEVDNPFTAAEMITLDFIVVSQVESDGLPFCLHVNYGLYL